MLNVGAMRKNKEFYHTVKKKNHDWYSGEGPGIKS